MPCSIQRRKVWTHRILLESMRHESSCFITLTYDDDHYPEGGSLVKKDFQDWLKRFRKALEPIKVRYYACGEYGTVTHRPHYHACIFGVGVSAEDLVLRTWTKGFSHVGDLTRQSAQYVAGYVTKKMKRAELNGRTPEFSIMSLKPGIGAGSMGDVAQVLLSKHGSKKIAQDGDVPLDLNHGNVSLPLGRYLRSKLREECGFETSGAQEKPTAERTAELLAMRKDIGTLAYVTQKPFVEWYKSDRKIYRNKLRSKDTL